MAVRRTPVREGLPCENLEDSHSSGPDQAGGPDRHRPAKYAFSGDFLTSGAGKERKNPAPQAPAGGREGMGKGKGGKGGEEEGLAHVWVASGVLHGLQTRWAVKDNQQKMDLLTRKYSF